MSTLEQQCEEIRNENATYSSPRIDALLAYIDELRRHSDAKEIAAIQERQAERHATRHLTAQCFQDVDTLLHALAESQRECARQTQWSRAWHTALQAAAVVVEADSNGSPSEVAQSIRARFDQLQAEIARLSSPPEERRDIVERHAQRKKVNNNFPSCYLPELMSDIDTLLQDLRAYRNAHAIVMGERDAARERVVALEAKCALHAASEAQLDKRVERLEGALRMVLLVLGVSDRGLTAEQQAQVDLALAAADGQNCEKCGADQGWHNPNTGDCTSATSAADGSKIKFCAFEDCDQDPALGSDLCQAHIDEGTRLCCDCPPVCYPTDETRCHSCPRRAADGQNSGEAE